MNAEIQFDFNRAESLRIYPKKDRKKLTSSPTERKALTALKACEKELKFIMGVANDRGNDIKKLVKEQAETGLHLIDQPFIPEYLGFKEVIMDSIEGEVEVVVRIYAKQGFNITHIGDSLYLVYCPNGQKPVVRIRNMYEAIMMLGGLSVDVTFEGYFAGEYSSEKSIEEVLTGAMTNIAIMREDAKLLSGGES